MDNKVEGIEDDVARNAAVQSRSDRSEYDSTSDSDSHEVRIIRASWWH